MRRQTRASTVACAEAGRGHHARREAEHGVEQSPVEAARQEDDRRAKRGHAPGEAGCQQRLHDRVQGFEGREHAGTSSEDGSRAG